MTAERAVGIAQAALSKDTWGPQPGATRPSLPPQCSLPRIIASSWSRISSFLGI